MKTLIVFLLSTAALAQENSETFDMSLMQEVDVVPTHVFAPSGFDDNDNVQLVVDGELPNTCYKQGPVDFTVDPKTKTILIRQKAYVRNDEGCFCLEVIVHYNSTLNLGALDVGQYRILVQGATSPRIHDFGVLNVAKAPEGRPDSPDDFLYAPVESVHVEYPEGSMEARDAVIHLDALFQNTCWKMGEAKIKVSQNIIEVLPLAKVDAKGKCVQIMRRESIAIPLNSILKDQVLTPGRYLIHVRSLNGNALNLVTEF